MRHVTRRLQVSIHVGKFGLDELEVGDGLPKLLPFFGILEGDFQGRLDAANHADGEEGALQVQSAHDDLEALVDFTQYVLLRHEGILKYQFTCRRSMHAHLLQFARNVVARRVGLKDKGGDAATASFRARLGIDDNQIRDRTVGDKHFGSIEQVAADSLACSHLKVAAAAAILFWYRNTRIALFRQALPYPGWKIIGALYFCIMGSNFVLREGICAFISELMLFWKFKIHEVAVLSDTAEQLA